MSNFPTIKKLLESLLNIIIALKPPKREAKAKPALHAFLSHPTIQLLLNKGQPPAQKSSLLQTPDISEIQKTLSMLTKALEGIQKPSTTPRQQPSSQSKVKDKTNNPTHTYSVVAGARPPNPSLIVDLSHLGIAAKDWVRLEILCDAINRKLVMISPPQVMLAAIR